MPAESFRLLIDRSLFCVLIALLNWCRGCSRDVLAFATLCYADSIDGYALVVFAKYLDLLPDNTVRFTFVGCALFLEKLLVLHEHVVFVQHVLWEAQTFAFCNREWL